MAVTINAYADNIPNGAITGVQMCDSPVVISGSVGTGTFPSGSSMHKAWVRVAKVTYDSNQKLILDGDSSYRDISFSAECGESFTTDISGALRALLDEFVFDPHDIPSFVVDPNGEKSPVKYPVLQYSVAGGFSYLQNGIVEITNGSFVQQSMYAVHGRLTELERLTLGHNGLTYKGNYLLSRKPDEVEETALNCTPFVTAIHGGLYSESESNSTPPSLIPIPTSQYPRSTYTDPLQKGYAEFCFINRLGGVETVCARTLETLSVEPKQEVYPRVQAPRRIPRTHGNVYVHQQDIYDRYAMSSGPVSRAWSQWWAREFLTASAWWVRLTPGTGTWIPCTVSPAQNKVSIYNRSSDDPLHVDFDVTLTLT